MISPAARASLANVLYFSKSFKTLPLLRLLLFLFLPKELLFPGSPKETIWPLEPPFLKPLLGLRPLGLKLLRPFGLLTKVVIIDCFISILKKLFNRWFKISHYQTFVKRYFAISCLLKCSEFLHQLIDICPKL